MRRAVFTTLGLGVAVFAYAWLAKGTSWLYAREPWREDPYDGWISFMFGAFPLLLGATVVRLRLCQRSAALPLRRVVDLLRLCRLLSAAMVLTVLTEWVAVVLVGNGHSSTPVFLGFVAALGVVSSAVAWGACRLLAALPVIRGQVAPAQPDWLADAVTLAERESERLRRVAPRLVATIRWTDRTVGARVRLHPVGAAAVFAFGFSLLTDSTQIMLEGYGLTLAIWVLMVSSCSFFAFVLLVGRYLPLIELRPRPVPPVYLALFAATLTVPVVASFRQSLAWSVAATPATLDLSRLVALTILWPLGVAAVVLTAASGYLSWRPRHGQTPGT